MSRRRCFVAFLVLEAMAVVFIGSSATAARTDGSLYGVSFDSNQLVRIDPLTAATEVVGPLGLDASVFALTYYPPGGTLLAHDRNAQQLLSIDIRSGAASVIGPVDAKLEGLAYDPNSETVYGVGSNLVVVDPATGSTVTVGEAGYGFNSLAFDSIANTLYGDSIVTGLSAINTVSGAAALISRPPSYWFWADGMAFDAASKSIFALYTDGVEELYRVDAGTLDAELVGPLSGFIAGLAFVPVPEPVSLALLVTGSLSLTPRRRQS